MKSARLRLHVVVSRLHRWLAIIIGAQLLLWFASGALMSFLPIERVRGEHLVDREPPGLLPAQTRYADPATLIQKAGAPVQSLTFRMMGNRVVAEAKTEQGVKLFDAGSGKSISRIGASEAVAIAKLGWKSADKPAATAAPVTQESTEYRGPLPAWRVSFADPDSTNAFVSAETGRIAAVRTGQWRLYDFFWGLHIMDWKGHENFNTPWLLGFAIGGLLLWLAGGMLLYLRWPWRRRLARASAEAEI